MLRRLIALLIVGIALAISAPAQPTQASGCVGTSGGVCPLGSHWDYHSNNHEWDRH
jgi:hypothetical protein